MKFLSVKSIVIAPAKTGNDNKRRNAVIKTAHTKSGVLLATMPGARIFKIVTIKFIAPKIEETPAKCKLKIAISTEAPEWDCTFDNGGYTVQPVPTPASIKEDETSNIKAGGNNQKDILFKRGKAMSQAPIIIGTNQLPKSNYIFVKTKSKRKDFNLFIKNKILNNNYIILNKKEIFIFTFIKNRKTKNDH